jgi:hypothetical protein
MATWSFLSSSIGFWEFLEYFFESAVIVGCTGEALGEFTNFLNVRNDQIRKDRLLKISTIILLLGLAGALASTVRTNVLAGKAIDELDGKAKRALADSNTAVEKSGDAVRVASSAEDTSKSASAESKKAEAAASDAFTLAAGAGREADSFKRQIAALAEFEAPRALDPFAMIDELIRKPSSKAEIFFELPGDLQQFSARLYNVLHTAHWIVSPPQPVPQENRNGIGAFLAATVRLGGRTTGITLVVSSWTEQTSGPVVALFEALRKQLGNEVVINTDASVTEGTIRIVVAQKPFQISVGGKP